MTRPFADYDGFELWFLTGSQGLYGEETLRHVAAQSQQVVATLNAASDVPVRIVVAAGADRQRVDPAGDAGRQLR